MKKQVAKKTNHNRSAFLAYGLLTLMVVGIAIGGISAKYFREIGQETGVVHARDFFFTSNLLTDVNPVRTLMTSGETASIDFELRNYESDLRWAHDDVSYTVSVTDEEGHAVDATISSVSGTIAKGSNNAVTITVGNMKVGETYVITAVGKAGYVETLKATLVIVNDQKVYKSLTTTDEQVILTVRTENVRGNAKFTIPAGLIPDKTATKDVLDLVNNYNTSTNSYDKVEIYTDSSSFISSTPASQKYCFIKENPSQTYTIENFGEVTVDGAVAVEETLTP